MIWVNRIKFKRITNMLGIAALSIGLATLSGCGGAQNMERFAKTDIKAAMNDRITSNEQLAERLCSAGFISKTTLNGTKQSLEEIRNQFNKGEFDVEINGNGKMTDPGFSTAVSYWQVLGGAGEVERDENGNAITIKTYKTPDYVINDVNTSGEPEGNIESPVIFPTQFASIGSFASISPVEWVNYTDTKLATHVLSNYIVGPGGWNLDQELYSQPRIDASATSGQDFGKRICVESQIVQGKGINNWYGWKNQTAVDSNKKKGVFPLKLIDDKAASEVNEKFAFYIYVLSPDKIDSMPLDEVISLVKDNVTKDGNGNITSIGKLNNYFEPLRDKNGKSVTLLDMTSSDENLVVKESKQNPIVTGGTDPKKPGYDMVISQYGADAGDSSTGYPIMTLRLVEFNTDGIDKLDEVIGITENRFLFYNGNDDDKAVNVVYLMEYPVYVLNSLKDRDTEEKGVVGELTKSGIGVNIATGKIVKYEQLSNGSWSKAGKVITEDSKDLYLTVGGAKNESERGKSSFIIQGKGQVTVQRSIFSHAKDVSACTGRIILRDYLEATYAPQYTSDGDEDLSVFGRKIRVDFNDWEEVDETIAGKKVTNYIPVFTKGADMAHFVDLDGNEIVDSPKLKPTDFCTAEKLLAKNKGSRYVARMNYPGETEGEIPAKFSIKEKEEMDITELPVKTMNQIYPVTMFPSTLIGETDWATDTEQKQRFYCLTTTKGLFDSNLFSGWIESTSSTASLDWWNKYLSDNGFSYKVSHEDLLNWLSGNYAYQLSQNGIVILDIETVAKIQDMYDKDANHDKVKRIRTVFVVVGWFFISISMVLMLLWVIDTNSDMGFSLIEKVTFGHWVSVKYDSDIPSHNSNGQVYLTGGKMFVRCLLLVAIGILLMRVNAFEIVEILIRMFGTLGAGIEKMVRGVYY